MGNRPLPLTGEMIETRRRVQRDSERRKPRRLNIPLTRVCRVSSGITKNNVVSRSSVLNIGEGGQVHRLAGRVTCSYPVVNTSALAT